MIGNENRNYKVLIALMGMEIGGAETHVLELCKALHNKGADVYVVSNGGAYEKELLDSGIKHFRAPLHNKKFMSLVRAYFTLKNLIKEYDIKLVHAHARIPAFLCGMLKKKLGFRFVTTAHLNFNTVFPYKVLTNWGEASLAVSDDIKDYLVDNYGLQRDKILTTINGIDTDKFTESVDFSNIAREFSFDMSKRRIVYLSRMDTDRSLGAHKLIECAEEIYRKHSDIEIVIVGGGNDYENVRRKIDELNKKLGFSLVITTDNRTDVNKFISSADYFVGVSRSVLEAMAAKKPCLVAGNQGYIGIFDDSKLDIGISTNFCCRGCEDTTTPVLQKDMLELLSYDKQRLIQMGEYNRRVIEEHYSVDRMADDAFSLYEMVRKSDRPIDVLISGYYGSNNHGDDALLKAITDDMRALKKDIKIAVLSKRPKETSRIYGINAIHHFNIPKLLKYLKNTNLLLLGGGTLVQDLTSTRSLIYYLSVINAAVKRGAKTMLYANGIGPLRLPKNRARAVETLKKVDIITLRDEISLRELNELGIQSGDIPVKVTADAAFGLRNTKPESSVAVLKELGLSGKKYFCIAIRGWKYLRDNFEAEMVSYVNHVRNKYGYEALFIAMQPQKDTDISKRVMDGISEKTYFLGGNFSLNEILGVVGSAEFVVGMRLHTIIYAARERTPVIGLVYDPKVKGLMQMLGQQLYLNVENMNSEELIKFTGEVIDNRMSISNALLEKSRELEAMAFENVRLAGEIINRNIF